MNRFKKLASAFAVTLFALQVQAQTIDDVVSKHIEAVGGAEAWKKVNSVAMEGTIKTQGAEIAVKQTVLQDKGQRQDIAVGGMNGFVIITPTAGWQYYPFQGQMQPEPMTEEVIKEQQSSLNARDEFVDYKERGTTLELLGKDDVDGTECYKVLVTYKSGKTATMYIDTKSNLILKQVDKEKANGQEMDNVSLFSNYKKLPEGIVIPMSIALGFGELNITKVEVNKPVDEALFKPSK